MIGTSGSLADSSVTVAILWQEKVSVRAIWRKKTRNRWRIKCFVRKWRKSLKKWLHDLVLPFGRLKFAPSFYVLQFDRWILICFNFTRCLFLTLDWNVKPLMLRLTVSSDHFISTWQLETTLLILFFFVASCISFCSLSRHYVFFTFTYIWGRLHVALYFL